MLRRALGSEVILSRGDDALAIAPGTVSCDCLDFDAALERGDVPAALDLYEGEFLAGLELSETSTFEHWLEGERARLRTAAVQAALAHSATLEGQGELSEAAYWTRHACGWAPYDEGTLRSLYQRLVRCGDRNGAVREYEGFVARLRTELDLEPEAETVELMDRLRREGNGTARGDSVQKDEILSFDPPASSDLEGPGEDQEAVRPGAEAGRWIWIAAAVVASVALALGGWGQRISGPVDAGTTVSYDVRVSPLGNRTGDPGLDPLGGMAADFIFDRLQEATLAAVWITPIEAAGLRGPADRGSSTPVLDGGGRGLVVRGSYELAGDSVRLRAQIVDEARAGPPFVVAPVMASRLRPAEGLKVLAESAAAALAMITDPVTVPEARYASAATTLRAFEDFSEGLAYLFRLKRAPNQRPVPAAIEYFLRSADADSTFTLPLLWAINTLKNGPRRAEADSLARRLLPSRNRLAPLDRAVLDALFAQLNQQYLVSLDGYRRALSLAPGSGWVMSAAGAALSARRPAEAVSFLVDGAARNALLEESTLYWQRLAGVYHALGELDASLRAARRLKALPPNSPADVYNGFFAEAKALAALGRIRELMAQYDSIGPVGLFGYRHVIVGELRAHGFSQAADELMQRVLDWNDSDPLLTEQPQYLRDSRWGDVWMTAGRWTKALESFDAALNTTPDNPRLRANRAFVAGMKGERSVVTQDRIWFENQGSDGLGPNTRLIPGMRDYYLAVVAAGLGERERVLQHLTIAIRRGRPSLTLDHQPYFVGWRGDPEFETLWKPRG